MRSGVIYSLIFILLVTGLSLWINFAPEDEFFGLDVSTRPGLDLQGGIQVVLRAEEGSEATREEMETAAGVIERRVNALGVGETVVQLSGEDSIIVELPGVEDPEQAVETIRGTGRLEFIDPRGQPLAEGILVRTTSAPEIPEAVLNPELSEGSEEITGTEPLTDTANITGTDSLTDTGAVTGSTELDLASQLPLGPQIFPPEGEEPYESITDGADLDTNQVQPTTQQQFGSGVGSVPAVSFAFTGGSASSLATFTARNVGQFMCIVLDHAVVSCPTIQSPLTDGSGVITTFSSEDQSRIFNQLKFGALPIPLQVETSRSVSATLGEESVEASILAGIIGLSVVGVFMVGYYRLPGIGAVVALLIYTSLNFAFYRLIPVVLTLPGIAGFILSIGLAVDANVLIFGRLKEELRKGRDVRTAVEVGFKEAWSAIRDSSISTLITSAVLWLFGNALGVSLIKGFALTLGIGVVLSLFTAVFVTRTFLRLVVPLAPQLWWYGVVRTSPTTGEAEAEPEPEMVGEPEAALKL